MPFAVAFASTDRALLRRSLSLSDIAHDVSERPRSKVTGIIVAMCVLATFFALPEAPADAAKKRCGSVGSGMDRLVVRVERGPVGCREAMKVARLVHAGSMRVGKWRCDGGAGGIGCTKSKPRARITMLVA